jgi:citronellyl-CoA synthetase
MSQDKKSDLVGRETIPFGKLVKAVVSDMLKFPKPQSKLIQAVWNLNTIKNGTKVSLSKFFLKSVNKYPDNILLYYQDQKWTYREFNEWVNRLGNQLLSMGLKKGDIVVVFLDNRPEVLALNMALAKIGCVGSLVNYSQKKQPLAHSIKLSNPKLILVGSELIDSYLEVKDDVIQYDDKVMIVKHPEIGNGSQYKEFDSLANSHSKEEPKLSFDIYAKDPYMYVFTSGTTGFPKAAIGSHSRFIKGYSGFGLALMQLEPTDILYVPLPFYHSTANIVCWTSAIAGGAAVVLKRKFSTSEFWPDIHKYKATGFGYVGELCKYLLNAPPHPLEKNSTLKKMVGNGLRPSIWMEFKNRFGIEKIGEFYASSEGNLAFFNLFNQDKTMGFSVNDFIIVEYDKEKEQPILDKKGFMKEVPKGGIGLLLGEITEKYPFDGYTEKDKSEKVILRNVLKKGDSYFNTGDLVFNMGFKHTQFVDRLGDTFRWKSENVSTTEVEAIINNFDNVSESIVYGVEIPNTPGRAGMANLILKDNVKPFDFKGFLAFMKKELPSYAIPIFLRVSTTTVTTETMKHQKNHLKDDGYDVQKVKEPLYFLEPHGEYVPLTKEMMEKINNGGYKL